MSDFEQAFEQQTAGLDYLSAGACPGCADCGLEVDHTDDEYDMANEGHFSRSWCDTCGSRFGGDRYPAHANLAETGELVHLDVCTDCLMYMANGEEPETWQPGPA